MSDPPPTAPKVGSLRDRIRQFDQKPATPESAAAPSAPRGKLGQWKPKPIERQEQIKQDEPVAASQATVDDDSIEPDAPERSGSGGMSAADARAAITKGGGMTMKERMAALAAASPSPPPVPVATKPAPRRQPLSPPVISPDEDAIEPGGDDDIGVAPAVDASAAAGTAEQADLADESTEQVELDKTEEELERERRAAIAARMARLGGTRVGMAPAFGRPAIPSGPKPVRKESHDSKAEDKPLASPVSPTEHGSVAGSAPGESRAVKQSRPSVDVPTTLLSPPEEAATLEISPSPSPSLSPAAAQSMPIPSAPRRALPPRKKVSRTPATSPKGEEAPQGLGHGLPYPAPNGEQAGGDSVKLTSEELSRANPAVADEANPAAALDTNTSSNPTDEMAEHDHDVRAETGADTLYKSDEEEDEASRRARIAERLSKAGGRSAFSPPAATAQRPTTKSPAVPDEEHESDSHVVVDLRMDDDARPSEARATRRIREEDGARRATRSFHEDRSYEELGADEGEAARVNAEAPSPAATPLLPARNHTNHSTSSRQPSVPHELGVETDVADDTTGEQFETAREPPSAFSPSAPRLDNDHEQDSEDKHSDSQFHQDSSPVTAHDPSDSMVIGRIAQPPIRSTYSPTLSRANSLQGKTAATSPKDSRPTSPNAGTPRSPTRSNTLPSTGRAAPLPPPTSARRMSSISRKSPSETLPSASILDVAPAEESEDIDAADEEEEEDAAARRRRITDKLSRTGGHNPYGPPAVPGALRPTKKPTTDAEPISSEVEDVYEEDVISSEQDNSAPPSPRYALPPARASTTSVGGTPSHPRAASQPRPSSPPAADGPPSPPTPPSPELSPVAPSNEPTPIGSQEVLSSSSVQPTDLRATHPPRVLRSVSPASASPSLTTGLAPPTRARPPVPGGPRLADAARSASATSKRASLPPTVPLPPVPPQRSVLQSRAARASLDSRSDEDVVDPGVTLSDEEPSPIAATVSRLNAPLPPRPDENEVMSEDDGDPIDPSIHTPTRSTPGTPGLQTTHLAPSTLQTSSSPPSASVTSPISAAPATAGHGGEDEENDEEPRSRPQTLAERMAKLGAVKIGGPPPIGAPPPPRQKKQASEAAEDSVEASVESQPQTQHEEPSQLDHADEEQEPEHEQTEEERRRAIVARLTAQGGLRPGMMAFGAPRPPVSRRVEDGEDLAQSPPHRSPPPLGRAPPVPAALARAPPVPTARAPPVPGSAPARAPPVPGSAHPSRSLPPPPPPPPVPKKEPKHEEETTLTYLEDGEEEQDDRRSDRDDAGDDEEVDEAEYEEADEVDDIPPPLPSPRAPQASPPPLPPGRRTGAAPPVPGAASGRTPPPPPRTIPPPPAPPSRVTPNTQRDEFARDEYEESAPPPPPPPPPPPRAYPPRSPTAASMASYQWELPAIGRDSIDLGSGMGNESFGAAARATSPHAPPQSPPPPPPPATSPPPTARRKSLDSDELTDLSRRLGAHVLASAQSLAAHAKNRVVGDGTSAGYVYAVLEGVPSAVQTETGEFGHAIYVQTGSAVQLRRCDIAPGDIVHVQNAQFAGRKVLKAYKEHVDDAYGVVMEFERKHGKIRVFKANQTANAYPAVEQHSWKLEDLKSGTLRVYRVAEAA